uniref:J domain-containing protein n=1 Tax=Arundo donax TaxID=35708 RepID=A0A0A9DH05_ARUDO
MAISEQLWLKAAGNEAFQAGKYSTAVEHYTAALLSNTESLRFSAICFCNRAAAYQAMGQILDAIADCSLAIALDSDYSKAISRRSSFYELIRDYGQAANDLRRLISLLEKQLQENISMPSEKTDSIRSNLNRANLRFSSLERDARKGASLNMYLILGIEPSCSIVDIKKAYRKAALRHHPDKAGKFLVRSENISNALWRQITNDIRRDADYLFKLIGKAYAMLSDPTVKSK